MKYRIIGLLLVLLVVWGVISADTRREISIQPERVMDVIGVKPGMTIGIAGAGKGFFTFKMCQRVGASGRIYANEINENKIKTIKKKCQRDNIKNVTTILGEITDPLFPRGKMDMVFMCYVFHDLAKPVEFLRNIKKSLKPGGRVVILDQDPGKTGSDHFFTREKLLRLVARANYDVLRIETFLVKDNIYICQPGGQGN